MTLHLTERSSHRLRQIPYRARICEPEVSLSSLLARFPAEEMVIFAIQAAEINRHGGKREPGSGRQEAFNWATSHQGETMGFSGEIIPKLAQGSCTQQDSINNLFWKIVFLPQP